MNSYYNLKHRKNITNQIIFVGNRFALMEIKAILYYLLLNFSFEANKYTQIPLKMKKVPFIMTEKGVHLELRPREHFNRKKEL